MKDVNQVLKEKEAEMDRVTREVEALRAVAPLLYEDDDTTSKRPPRNVPEIGETASGSLGKH